MMRSKRYISVILTLTILLFATMFLGGNFIFFNIVYALVFLYMVARTLMVPSRRRVRAYMIALYGAVAAGQITYNMLVAFADHPSRLSWLVCRIFAIAMVMLPIIIEKQVTISNYQKFYLPSVSDLANLSFADLKANKNRVLDLAETLQKAGKGLAPENLLEMATDLPRHNSFRYVNQGNLTEAYFEEAYASLADPFLYIVISNTGSAASEIISVFTRKQYNHASLAFDYDLKTVISYNGGARVYPPGLNPEMIEFFNQKEDASIIVYKLACTREQKKQIIDKVQEINAEGSAYNMMGLLTTKSHKPNIMFCSQFVYKMLELSGLTYFEKEDGKVKPTDLIEMDYHRKLQFAYEVQLNRRDEDAEHWAG